MEIKYSLDIKRSVIALQKADVAFSRHDNFRIEKLTILEKEWHGTGTQLYMVNADCSWAQEIVATDLYYHTACAIAHALSAVYNCEVYDGDGKVL